ncbi:cation efflux family-domain-containing protein [Gloeopeniophorella convolvens]|nr:cation efflux family-domain-containing protein [Gloeopeniophorella convolvens]
MDFTDSRTRKKVTLNPRTVLSNSVSRRVVTDVIFSNALLVAALWTVKEWLLAHNVGPFWILMRVLACNAVVLVFREWVFGDPMKSSAKSALSVYTSTPGFYLACVAQALQVGSLFVALSQLSATRVAIFTHFSSAWARSLSSTTSNVRFTPIAIGLAISFASDTGYSIHDVRETLPGYLALIFHVISTGALEHFKAPLIPNLGHKHVSTLCTLGAAMISLVAYMLREAVINVPPTPVVPLFSLLAIPLAAYSTQYRQSLSELSLSTSPQYYTISATSVLAATVAFGFMWFSRLPTTTEMLMGLFLSYGGYPKKSQSSDGLPHVPATQLARSYLKTIMSNPESRRIFYFLMLNLSYMMVQMLYGIWTNSLGLISDAIHMLFDCMAIGVGLFASIMATWPPNERFTYGYGRIETLSGFANGIFLILISIFIIFEAVQRLLDPPEMNTNQLLLVSVVGLCVNLFGMLATGGHAHHGHSHGHGHDHGHGHSHGHAHAHDHAHEHTHSHSPVHAHAHDHDGEHDGQFHNHDEDHHHASPSPPSPGHLHSSHDHECEDPDHDHDHDHVHSAHSHPALTSPRHSHSPSHSASAPHTHQGLGARPEVAAGLLHPQARARAPGLGTPPSRTHARSASMAGFPSPAPPAPHEHTLPHSQTTPTLALPSANGHRAHSRRAPSLQIHDAGRLGALRHDEMGPSPVTPNYRFGVDEGFAAHQQAHAHAPNLHDHSHVHGHGHSHAEGHSHNMRGVFLHVMADTLGSVGVIVSTLLIQFYGWTGFDPLASIFIALLIAASVIPLVIDTGKVLALDVADRGDAIAIALDELASVDGLAAYTSPQFWPKDSSSLIGALHVQLDAPRAGAGADADVGGVVGRVDALLRARIPGLEELTIQVEEAGGAARGLRYP